MFGQNIKLPPENTDGSSLKVTEIFETIQGEGPLAGRAALFIRLSGCNLACSFCDTEFDSYEVKNLPEILSRAKPLSDKIRLVVITGGEPMRQNIAPLCDELISLGFEVQVETNGTIYRKLHPEVMFVCSPKFEGDVRYKIDPRFFAHRFHYKFLIRADEQRVTQYYEQFTSSTCKNKSIYLQPMDEYDDGKNALNLAHTLKLVMDGGFSLSLQLHKILGVA